MSLSIWMKQQRAQRTCDVCVIGGGIVGVSAARALASAGLDVLLVERGNLAQGASGRNAGYLMRGAADNYAVACAKYRRNGARALWRLSEANLEMLRASGVDRLSTYRACPSCLLAYDAVEADEFEDSDRLLREDGFETEVLRVGDDSVWKASPPLLGLINPNDAVVNPVELVRWLAGPIGERVLTGEEVKGVRAVGNRVVVETAANSVRCDAAVVCTNAHARALLPSEAARIEPNRGQMLSLAAPSNICRLDHAYYANRGSEYFRRADADTVVVGGWRKHFEREEQTESHAVSDGVQQGLEAFAERVLGTRFGVRDRWAGTMGFTPDGLPIAGETSLPGVWMCAGFNGHGMSLGHAAATLVADGVAKSLGREPVDAARSLGPISDSVLAMFNPGRFAPNAVHSG